MWFASVCATVCEFVNLSDRKEVFLVSKDKNKALSLES